jgi:hypothetical protein
VNIVQIFMGGGLIGFLIIFVAIIGWIGCFRTWRKGTRRSVVILATIFATAPLALGMLGTWYGYAMMEWTLHALRSRPNPPSEAMLHREAAYSTTLAWSTTISGTVFAVSFILIALLAIAVKRDEPAE